MQAFVTGSSSGIGKALSELLLEKGIKVEGLARNTAIRHANYTHHFLDLSMPKAVQSFKFKVEATDTLILVNNAGVLGAIAPFDQQNSANASYVMQVNFHAPVALMHKFLQLETPAKKVILNISSGAANASYDGWSMYSASKAALDAFSRVVAAEQKLQASNTYIFSISPGVIDTPMQTQIRTVSKDQFSAIDRFIQLKENGQLAHPENVAADLWQVIASAEKIDSTIFRLSDLAQILAKD